MHMLLQRCGIEKRNINQAILEYDKCLALDKEKGRFEYHSTSRKASSIKKNVNHGHGGMFKT